MHNNGFIVGFRRLFCAHRASCVIFSLCILRIVHRNFYICMCLSILCFLNGSCNFVGEAVGLIYWGFG